jgi:hypothetical protein
MVHCGYEPTAVSQTFGSLRGFVETARAVLFGPRAGSPLELEPVLTPVGKRVESPDADESVPHTDQPGELIAAHQLPIVTT